MGSIIVSFFCSAKQAIKAFMVIFSIFLASNVAANTDIKKLITDAETKYQIPSGLLISLAKVESNVNPYAVNIAGIPMFAKSKLQAVNAIKDELDKGIQNIDVGVMQVNYKYHGSNFDSLEEMITPEKNIKYAAELLTKLYKQHGTWQKAVRYYHSANSEYHKKYSRKVLIAWLTAS